MNKATTDSELDTPGKQTWLLLLLQTQLLQLAAVSLQFHHLSHRPKFSSVQNFQKVHKTHHFPLLFLTFSVTLGDCASQRGLYNRVGTIKTSLTLVTLGMLALYSFILFNLCYVLCTVFSIVDTGIFLQFTAGALPAQWLTRKVFPHYLALVNLVGHGSFCFAVVRVLSCHCACVLPCSPTVVCILSCCPTIICSLSCPAILYVLSSCPTTVCILSCCPTIVYALSSSTTICILSCCPTIVCILSCCPNILCILSCCPAIVHVLSPSCPVIVHVVSHAALLLYMCSVLLSYHVFFLLPASGVEVSMVASLPASEDVLIVSTRQWPVTVDRDAQSPAMAAFTWASYWSWALQPVYVVGIPGYLSAH